MFYECWLFTNYQSCFYDFPKGKQKKERFQVYSFQARIKGWPFPALGGPRGLQPWKIQLGSMVRKANGFEVGSRWGLLSPMVRWHLAVGQTCTQSLGWVESSETAKDTSFPPSFLLMSLLIHKGPRKESQRPRGILVCAHRKHLRQHILPHGTPNLEKNRSREHAVTTQNLIIMI